MLIKQRTPLCCGFRYLYSQFYIFACADGYNGREIMGKDNKREFMVKL